MTLCDTGILVELTTNRTDPKSLYRPLISAEKMLLTSWPCITEAMYLLNIRGGGWPSQAFLARALKNSLISVFEIQSADYARMFDLMEIYRDRPMDLADASLVLAAERTGERKILTIDSDFFFYRINKTESFDVIMP